MAGVHTVVVNYRTAGLTVDCLRSLAPEFRSDSGLRVTVVDGGSGDDSADRIAAAIRAEGWEAWCDLLPLEENRGFSAGNNAALRSILGTTDPPAYVWLLNPDTVVRPGACSALRDFLDARPTVGIAGSRLEDPDGSPQRSAFRFPSLAGEFEGGVRFGPVTKLLRRHVVAPPVRNEAHPTDWVSGASLMIRREVFDAIGLLDEGYFLYYEETDFCLRARRAGWPCWYLPSSRVVHLVGRSTGSSPARVSEFMLRSRRRYLTRSHGKIYRLLCDAAWAVGYASWRVRRRIQRKPNPDPKALLNDFVTYSLRWNP